MQTLYKPNEYPEKIRQLVTQSRMGIELANRWMLGWPKSVMALIKAGEYPAAFESQLAQEIEAEVNAANMSHLSSWEKAEVMGLSKAPPALG